MKARAFCLSLQRMFTGLLVVVCTATSALLHAQVWPMSGHDPQRTGRSSFAGPTTAPAAPDWVFSTPAPIVGDIVASAEDKLYFGSDKLYALNPDGSLFGSAVIGAVASTPAIDDARGWVYAASPNANGGFDITRFTRTLQNQSVVFQVAPLPFGGGISPLIVSTDGTLYFVAGRFPGRLFSLGTNTWIQEVCPTESGNNAPAVASDGSIYVSCDGQITKRDPVTGAQIASAFEDRNPTEPAIDSLNRIRAGWQAFTGATFCGDYKTWDSNLTALPSNPCGLFFATSRAAVLPDGVSTARISFAFFPNNFLEAEGAHVWSVATDHTNIPNFSSVPSSDGQGMIYVGTEVGIQARNSVDGKVLWKFDLGDPVTTQPVIATAGALYIGTKGGKVYGFNTQSLISARPQPPANLSAIVGDQSVYLFWDRVDGLVDDYVINYTSDIGDQGTLIFEPRPFQGQNGVIDQSTAVLLEGKTNGAHYVFSVAAERSRLLSTPATVLATPGAITGRLIPLKPSNPILFLHGFSGNGTVNTDGILAGTFAGTFKFLTTTLHWRYGGELYHDPPDSLEAQVDLQGGWAFKGDTPTAPSPTVDMRGDFFSGGFGNALGIYWGDNRGLSHQGDEVDDFVGKLNHDGISTQLLLIAHSNGGLAARDYITRSTANAEKVAGLITYGTPHRGADVDVLQKIASIVPNLRNGASDAAFSCNGNAVQYITSFLADLNSAARQLPVRLFYATIAGSATVLAQRKSDCHSAAWDGLVPISSADITQTPVFPLNASVRRFLTSRKHMGEGDDFSTILCAVNPGCAEFSVFSPVDVTIIAPDGREISPGIAEIPGAQYGSVNDSPGHQLTTITIPFPLGGSYQVRPVSKPTASPDDTFTITLEQNGVIQTLASAVRVADIPLHPVYSPVVNAFPIAVAGADQVVECSVPNGSNVVLNGTDSHDPDGDPITFEWADEQGRIVATTATANVFVPLGTHVFKLTVRDGRGGFGISHVKVNVQDTTPPALQVSVVPSILWPPNRKFVPIVASVSVNDACDPNPQYQLVSITSSEPDTLAFVSGATFGTADLSFSLRAERNAELGGRVYAITYSATDTSGNSSMKTVNVVVPHDDRSQNHQLL